jgi:hypothetical protein
MADQQADRLTYLPEAIERINQAISDARRPWRSQAEQAKLLAGATSDATDVLMRLSGDDDLWDQLALQRDLPIAYFKLPLTPRLLTSLGYDEEEAEQLVAQGNRMLERLTTGPAKDRAAARRSVEATRQTVSQLVTVMQQVTEQADAGIENLQRRQGQIRRLLGLLYQVVQVLSSIATSIAVSAMFTPSPPSWAPPILASVAELRHGLGDGTLALLTFTAAEQGARIATAFGQPAAASLTSLRLWVEPSWRPLSAIADPHLVQELEKLFPDLRRPGASLTADQPSRESTAPQTAAGQESARVDPVEPDASSTADPLGRHGKETRIATGQGSVRPREDPVEPLELPRRPHEQNELDDFDLLAPADEEEPYPTQPDPENQLVLGPEPEARSGIKIVGQPVDPEAGQDPQDPPGPISPR